MSEDLILALLPALVPMLIIFLMVGCFCLPCICGKIRSCNATALPPQEAQQMINSIQGDWDVTLSPGFCICACTQYERMVVSGNIIARINTGRGNNRPITLRPARTSDGTLLLDTYGTKVVVFKPEEGRMETVMMGWKCNWRKANFQPAQPQQIVMAPPSQSGVADEIQRLHQLKQQGALTEEEFADAKQRLLNPGQSFGGQAAPYERPPPYPVDLEAGVQMKKY